MHTFLLALILCTSISQDALASELVRLTVPQGFEGPQSAAPATDAYTEAYVKKIPGEERGTLIQLTTYNFGARLAGLPKDQLGNAAETYLMQFLAGVERRRSSFSAAKPTRVALGGLPAARAEWTGISDGFQMSGVMYCVIVGTVVVTLHTQGFSDSPTSDREDSLRAIEGVTFDG